MSGTASGGDLEQVLVRNPAGRKGIPGRRHSKCQVMETGEVSAVFMEPLECKASNMRTEYEEALFGRNK